MLNVPEIKVNWKWLLAREFVGTGDKISGAVSEVLTAVIASRTDIES